MRHVIYNFVFNLISPHIIAIPIWHIQFMIEGKITPNFLKNMGFTQLSAFLIYCTLTFGTSKDFMPKVASIF